MRTAKRLIGMILVITIMCVLVVTPASALEPSLNTLFRKFDLTTRYNYQAGYTKLIQRFMQTTSYSSCIDDHGGVDGIFGDGTFQAVTLFQGNNGLKADGKVGENTWGTMASAMDQERSYFVRNTNQYIGRYEINNRTYTIFQVAGYGQAATYVCTKTA